MANLFIGFPVPRAKIATMIEEAAPPILHADRHEATGDDEISYLNLLNRKHASRHESGGDDEMAIPPGGIASLYADHGFHLKTFFPTLDEFETGNSGTGLVTHSHSNVLLETGGDSGSWCKIVKKTDYQLPVLTYDKIIYIKFRCFFNLFDDVSGVSYIITSNAENTKHVGLCMYNGKLGYTCHDGSGRAQGSILTLPGAGASYDKIIEIIHYPGEGIAYLIDGVLEHIQTYRQPSGDFVDANFLRMMASNSTTSNAITLSLSMLELYQPAT